MSEYQYYEFQALERTLTNADQSYLKQLSSRVELTATNAQFVYNYGDFRGDPLQVLERCFDLMLYVTNFGVRQLTLRLPKGLVNPPTFEPYCVPYYICVSTTEKSVIVDINLTGEDYYDWIEGEGWLSGLVALRDELLQGDLRLLYLAWLRAGLIEDADVDLEVIEPPVPPNLKQLSPALKTFVELFKVETDLIAAAAEASQTSGANPEPVSEWIANLSENERNHYLLRVVRGDPHVGVELIQQLRQMFSQPLVNAGTISGRSLANLMASAEKARKQRKHKEQLVAEKARQERLDALAPHGDALWQEVFRLIGLKQTKAYDQAIVHLKELRDLAEHQGNLKEFYNRIEQIKQQYTNRPGLISRLQKAILLKS